MYSENVQSISSSEKEKIKHQGSAFGRLLFLHVRDIVKQRTFRTNSRRVSLYENVIFISQHFFIYVSKTVLNFITYAYQSQSADNTNDVMRFRVVC